MAADPKWPEISDEGSGDRPGIADLVDAAFGCLPWLFMAMAALVPLAAYFSYWTFAALQRPWGDVATVMSAFFLAMLLVVAGITRCRWD